MVGGIKTNLLTDSAYYILLALNKPLHGYAIMLEVEKISEGLIKLGPATLYTVLSRLQDDGFIQGIDEQGQSDSRRKPYEITERGVTVLQNEVKRRYDMATHGVRILESIGVKLNYGK